MEEPQSEKLHAGKQVAFNSKHLLVDRNFMCSMNEQYADYSDRACMELGRCGEVCRSVRHYALKLCHITERGVLNKARAMRMSHILWVF